MSRRPDYADQPGGEAARMAQHARSDDDCCELPPISGWRRLSWRPLLNLIFGYLQVADKKLDKILKETKKMAEATAAALAELKKDILRLADGWAALRAENAVLKAALAEADATKAQAVADAIAADDTIDSAAIAEADAIVEGLSPEPVEPPVEEPPAEPAPA